MDLLDLGPGAALVVVALATYRLTRIVTTDTISLPARQRLYRWAWVEHDEVDAYRRARAAHGDDVVTFTDDVPNPPMPRQGGLRTYVCELVQCAWCMGVWIAGALVALWQWVDWSPVRWVILILAVAGAQGWLQSREG